MNLTYYTNYSLRVMMYLGLHPASLASITQISEAFGISRNHLIKVVHNLARQGFIKTTRGRGGGLRLARDPKEINLGEVVRRTEPSFNIVECFDSGSNTCPITPLCELKNIIRSAEEAFLSVLARYTLADVLVKRRQMAALLKIPYTRQSPLWLQGNNGRRQPAQPRA
jgi:Rrf2 family nitric oxide-sensitive transcriptional repressor